MKPTHRATMLLIVVNIKFHGNTISTIILTPQPSAIDIANKAKNTFLLPLFTFVLMKDKYLNKICIRSPTSLYLRSCMHLLGPSFSLAIYISSLPPFGQPLPTLYVR